MDWPGEVSRNGYGVVHSVFEASALERVRTTLEGRGITRSRAGVRHLMTEESITEIASSPEMIGAAQAVLGKSATPFRATYFEKSPASNWLVAWHQDTALPLRERKEVEGWGPWSTKGGVIYSHAPAVALEQVIALRLHLDDSTSENGPLRVLPGTQNKGVLTDEAIHKLSDELEAVECCSGAGGIILMRPLVVHASSKSMSTKPRRVLHIEYASSLEIAQGLRLAVV